MTSPAVDIVIATHNRPQSLALAVQSVLRQTVSDWRLLVVGDHCDADTATAMAAFDDPRIRYVNLPTWCGEQAIPNSLGLDAGRAPYLALLNHDDLWLDDHLERAMALLDRGHDWVVMQAVEAEAVTADGAPQWARYRHRPDTAGEAYRGESAEPASAWVFTRALWQRVGPWRHAREVQRAPLEDWQLRAWRSGARVSFSDQLTVLAVRTYWRHESRGAVYRDDPAEVAVLTTLLQRPAAEIRAGIEALGLPSIDGQPLTALQRFDRQVFYWLGIDGAILRKRLRDRRLTNRLPALVQARVGRALPARPDRGSLQRFVDERCREWT